MCHCSSTRWYGMRAGAHRLPVLRTSSAPSRRCSRPL
uniref:Uncharacterized protein n=1 Tax=Arundo donax TaxID=35708 RepID=A0A0A9BZ93_ARUDO